MSLYFIEKRVMLQNTKKDLRSVTGSDIDTRKKT